MKPLAFIFLFFSLAAFGQNNTLPDSGFTNKAEAQNLRINNIKTDNWYERLNSNLEIVTGLKDTNSPYYSLACYKNGEPNGIVRYYYKSGKIFQIIHYVGGHKNGPTTVYYENGTLQSSVFYINDEKCGVEKTYNEKGKLLSQMACTSTYNIADSGFTNKAEAKNLLVNGKREGKWIDTIYHYPDFGPGKTFVGYELAIYKKGQRIGIVREYDTQWNIETWFVLLIYTMHGTVLDKDTHKPIEGATVKKIGSDGSSYFAITDAKGNYLFDATTFEFYVSYIVSVDAIAQGYDFSSEKTNVTTMDSFASKIFTHDWELGKQK